VRREPSVSRVGSTGRTRPPWFGLALSILALIATVGAFTWIAILSYNFIHQDVAPLNEQRLSPVKITGPQQTVFDWSKQACEPLDIPDLPARAYRDFEGRVHLIASSYVSRAAVGRDLNRVKHACNVVMRSAFSRYPQKFADREWIASPYTIDGKTVFALVHDEYHGNEHRAGNCSSGIYQKCWYNAVTLSRSDDGGRTFHPALPPPGNLVAAIPYRYKPEVGPVGVFAPSNILRKGDYYYSLVYTERYGLQDAGSCLMRTANLADPHAWRAWDSDGFNVEFADPYKEGDAAAHVCQPVSPDAIGKMTQSLTFNTYFDKYLLVGPNSVYDTSKRRAVSGFYYSLSSDLIHWSRPKLIREAEMPWTYQCGDADPVLYPSVLDPSSSSRNFETTGRRPWLYFTRDHYFGCREALDRDLVRVPIEFSK
jgi:hypothetical protein